MSAQMIEVHDMVKSFGDFVAFHRFNLQVERGELVTLLGPSGCGKTTALRCITGGLRPDAGRVVIDGRDITDLPTHKRNIGLVFQNFALFPHLSVLDNVGYPLRVRGVDRDERRKRSLDSLALVGLKGLGDRYPRELSGGQQQRVGLARAIVYQPTVLLFDEPLSNLDARLRLEMRAEIASLKARLGFTAIYVTHDQEEALSLSDRIAVMEGGIIHQVGTPSEIYASPRTAFVAEFVGNPNRFTGRCVSAADKTAVVADGGTRISCSTGEDSPSPGDEAVVFVRPEDLEIREGGETGREDDVAATVMRASFLGDCTEYSLELANKTVWRLRLEKGRSLGMGELVSLHLKPGAAKAFSAPSQALAAARDGAAETPSI